MSDLDRRVAALRELGWRIEYVTESQLQPGRATGEKYHRGAAIREERETLGALVPLLEEHEPRLASDGRSQLIEASKGLTNL